MTVSGGQEALPGTPSGSAKVTALSEYPAKGRATGGVRAHRFLKGEDRLFLSWAGHGPAKASSSSGVARVLPVEHGHRDGSGLALTAGIDLVGPSLSGIASETAATQAPGMDESSAAAPATSVGTGSTPATTIPPAPTRDPKPIQDSTQEAFELPLD